MNQWLTEASQHLNLINQHLPVDVNARIWKEEKTQQLMMNPRLDDASTLNKNAQTLTVDESSLTAFVSTRQ